MNRVTRMLRAPGGSALAVAAVTIPLIVLLPAARTWVVLIALCVYPLLDVLASSRAARGGSER